MDAKEVPELLRGRGICPEGMGLLFKKRPDVS